MVSQVSNTLCGQGPLRRSTSNTPSGSKNVAGDGEFVGGCANVKGGVVEDEIFEMDEFAVDPEGSAGISEILAFDPPASDR